MTKTTPRIHSTASKPVPHRASQLYSPSNQSSCSVSVQEEIEESPVERKDSITLEELHPNTHLSSHGFELKEDSPSDRMGAKMEDARPKRVRNAQKRKMARLESRQQRKHQNIIPVMSKMIAATANTLDQQLGKMVQLSSVLYPEFVRCSCSVDPSAEHRNLGRRVRTVHSMMDLNKVVQPDQNPTTLPTREEIVAHSIELSLSKMMTALQLPSQCLTIAYAYIEKLLKQMFNSKLILSCSNAENVAITALLLAAKFYCETQDVVVNEDIARLMELASHFPNTCYECASNRSTASCEDVSDGRLLNKMESSMARALDFDLYVSLSSYNTIQSVFNTRIREQRTEPARFLKKKTQKKRSFISGETQAGSSMLFHEDYHNDECLMSVASLFE